MNKTVIPKRFVERYSGIVDDQKEFLEYLEKPLPKAFRINTIKSDKKQVLESLVEKGIVVEKVPWYEDGFVVNGEASAHPIGNTIEHFMGYIYIQELVSMLPSILASGEIGDKGLVLDVAAAPGSKTTHLAAIMGNKGCIIANDISYQRIKALKFNIEKLGVLNTVITNQDFRFFSFREKLDFILLDSPCTSEGTVRKEWDVLSEWSEKRIIGMCRLQKNLITKAFDMLKPGGSMVYSTCTFAPEENEEVIQHLLDNRNSVKIEKLELKGLKVSPAVDKWGKVEFSQEVQKVCRIWPHHNNTGGFFIAKVRKGVE